MFPKNAFMDKYFLLYIIFPTSGVYSGPDYRMRSKAAAHHFSLERKRSMTPSYLELS
ncbi:hypothetical protein SAMN04488556_1970 [Halostagnicola kamekurae]|uniref:Uncharacterized protein n=1 Tax=Halostagnicola kamekurae TaxID=619731 RepID=A0A1I6RPH9_9EURY|nr:hypothetical protein SAMN04488556_1970 [Halostagnicola kamekurae]